MWRTGAGSEPAAPRCPTRYTTPCKLLMFRAASLAGQMAFSLAASTLFTNARPWNGNALHVVQVRDCAAIAHGTGSR